jgi:TPP-dependent pyruvate/acetoin dehydrogenase alpha subunit
MTEPAVSATSRFERMLRIRRCEEEIRRLQLSSTLEGAVHLATGHEGVSVGVGAVLGQRDWVACTYRGHAHLLTRGVTPRALIAEMLGRATGVCGGRSGSMNIVAREQRVLGSFGIIGGSMAAATGAGVSLRGSGAAAVAFFGDGAANQGYFLECLNFALVLALPVLFVCENNLYSEYTRTDLVTASTIADRTRGIGVDTEVVDGMDVRAVEAAAAAALDPVRAGAGPRFLEAETYRFVPHSRSDPVTYQPDDEVARWRDRDPIDQERSRLLEEGVGVPELGALTTRIEDEIAEAVRAAFDDPYPDPASIVDGEFA